MINFKPTVPTYYLKRLLLLAVWFPYLLLAQVKNDSLNRKQNSDPHLGFFDLNVGLDLKNGQGFSPESPYYRWGWGVSARMQNSFVANYIYNPAKKYRIKIGDFMAAELGTGFVTGQGYGQESALLLAYRFDFGAMGVIRINDKNELGLTITALQFARDRISPNISGSNILVRYRYCRFVLQGGLEGRRDRVFGWINSLSPSYDIPMQYIAEVRYLFAPGKNIGARVEVLSDKNSIYISDGVLYNQIISVRVFYGIYF